MKPRPETKRPRRIVEYTACPDCDWWSVGVQANRRIVRHTKGHGSVERVGPGTRYPQFRPGPICPGSGKLVKRNRANDPRLSDNRRNWRLLLKAGGWWLDSDWIISTGYRREHDGTEMLIWNTETRRWEWYPHVATTMYEYESFKTLTAALLAAA